MGYFYNKGEHKVRPGQYQRYENRGKDTVAGALVGYSAITIQADWGPLNKVVTVSPNGDLQRIYGTGGTVADAQELFNGGASYAQICRIGTGGTKASLELKDGADVSVIKAEALYVGTREFTISIKAVLGDSTKKEFIVMEDATIVEKIRFTAGTAEVDALVEAAKNSEYVAVTKIADGDGTVAPIVQAVLTGGANPTVTASDYSNGFNQLETVKWNTISVDTDDNAVHALLVNYIDRVYGPAEYAVCVVGDPISVALEDRFAKSANYDNELVIYFGHAWEEDGVVYDGHRAVNRIAGLIASTPSNKSIVHAQILGATDVPEKLTNEQYISAIQAGCLMVSVGPDKEIWMDSGVNTLIHLDDEQDEGWKKIKRVAVRNEMMQRIDKVVAKKVGRVVPDSDGIASIVKVGQGVLNEMVAEGGKIAPGASFYVKENKPPVGDESWFVCDADDYDTLEEIYTLYRFRYSQEV